MLKITPIDALQDNYIWLLRETNHRGAIVVDPGEAKPVLETLTRGQLSLTAILVTHHHWDHTNGIAELLKQYPTAIVFGPAKEKVFGCKHFMQENDQTAIPNFSTQFKVLDIPGHTLGHIAYYGANALFCGDTLFTAGCGRIFEGTPEQMYQSLSKLAALPATTKIYCGHEYTLANLKFAAHVEPNNTDTQQRIKQVQQLRAQQLPSVPATLMLELQTNPFLRCESPSIISAVEYHIKKKLDNPVDVFAHLREWKNSFS